MKEIDLNELTADPLVAASLRGGSTTVTLSGFVRSVDEETISVCGSQMGGPYVEFPRSAVIATFSEEDSDAVMFVLNDDVEFRKVAVVDADTLLLGDSIQAEQSMHLARQEGRRPTDSGCGCEGSKAAAHSADDPWAPDPSSVAAFAAAPWGPAGGIGGGVLGAGLSYRCGLNHCWCDSMLNVTCAGIVNECRRRGKTTTCKFNGTGDSTRSWCTC